MIIGPINAARTRALSRIAGARDGPKFRYGQRFSLARETELLAYAATLHDETILEWRNTGPTILAWIRTHQRPPCDDECEVAAVDDFAAWSGATTFGKVLQATGWRVEVFWNSSGGWFTARLISPWDRSGNADYPGGFLAPFDNPIGASGASPEEAVSHLADAVLEWS